MKGYKEKMKINQLIVFFYLVSASQFLSIYFLHGFIKIA